MASKSPVFPIPEPQHFSDYGFDPQIDYFQVLEEARKHRRWENYCTSSTKPTETIHFKLQKPISKDEAKKSTRSKKRKWWFKNAILYLKSKWQHSSISSSSSSSKTTHPDDARAKGGRSSKWSAGPSSISGPIYVTESRSGSSTPYRNVLGKSRPSSGPLAGSRRVRGGEAGVPYFSLRELNMEETVDDGISSSSSSSSSTTTTTTTTTSPMPIYLVT